MKIEKVGGYMAFREVKNDEKTLFAKVMDDWDGVGYRVLAVSAQLVSGMNYRFLCEATVVSPDAIPYNVLVTIYAPLEGEPKMTNIKDIVIE